MNNEELDFIIENSFRTEPEFRLPTDFAQKVMFSVVKREQWKTDLYEYLFLTTVIISLLSVACGLYYFIDNELIMTIFAFISENVVLVVFSVILLNFILLADRVLLPLLFNRWSRS